jgi:hypothetical protein
MVEKTKSAGLRHRVKRMPMRAVVNKTADKARGRGLRLLLVPAYRNSTTCPVHGVELSFPSAPSSASARETLGAPGRGPSPQHVEKGYGEAGA